MLTKPKTIQGNEYYVVFGQDVVAKFGPRALREHKFLQKLGGEKRFPKTYYAVNGLCIQEKIQGVRLDAAFKGGVIYSHCTPLWFEGELRGMLALMQVCKIQHRDIRPENLIWDGDDVLYLIDFGWAKWADEEFKTPKHLGGKYRSPKGPSDMWAIEQLVKDYTKAFNKCKR